MEHSWRNFSASIVILLLVVMATEMAQVQAKECYSLHLSGRFHWLCLNTDHCSEVCRSEGKGYTGGKCLGWRDRCYCILPCALASAAAPEADQTGGSGGAS
ncbi:hypothetical protein EJB05_23574, partial [Eragrostis curvula]